jgi:hypothetical protein
MTDKKPTITYQLKGPFSYEHHDGEYERYIGYRNIDEFVEHSLQIVTPYTTVRITVEVFE